MSITDKQTLLQQEQELRQAVEFALNFAKQAGAEAEVGVTKVAGLSVSSRLEQVENIEFNNDGSLGISVYLGKRKGNASTSDLQPESIQKRLKQLLRLQNIPQKMLVPGLLIKNCLPLRQKIWNCTTKRIFQLIKQSNWRLKRSIMP